MKIVKQAHSIEQIISERIVLFDGAMGTMLQKLNLTEQDFKGELLALHSNNLYGNYDILSITQPEIIQSIHRDYLQSGADIIKTNSFNANRFSQENYRATEYVYQMNYNSAAIAKEACLEYDNNRFVAGSIGPSHRVFKSDDYELFTDMYYEQISGLCDGGADVLLIETVVNLSSCNSAINAAEKYFNRKGFTLPIFVSATLDKKGDLLDGSSLEEYYYSISKFECVKAIGLNCSYGAFHLHPFIERLAKISVIPIIYYPNAGVPNGIGESIESEKVFAGKIIDRVEAGFVNIIGGCCGTSPEYIKQIKEELLRKMQ